MMKPGTYDLWIYRGDSYTWMLRLWSDDHRMVPANLLGAQAKAEIRDKAGGQLRATLYCEVQLPNVIIMTLSARESERLVRDTGVWDLQITSIDEVTTMVRGDVHIEPDVTDSRVVDQPDTGPLAMLAFPKRGRAA